MLPLDTLLSDMQRAGEQALGGDAPMRGIAANPLALLSVVTRAEQRRLESQARIDAPVPRFGIVSVTWKCNLNCVGCYAKNYTRGSEMKLPEIARVLDEARELGVYLFVIVGGEPLTVPGLVEMLAERTDSVFFLFTNGTLMQPLHASAIAAATNILPVISLEGVRSLTDARRGAGVTEKVHHAIDLLREQRAALGCATVVTHENVDLVTSREWFDRIWEQGARFYFLIDYIPFPPDPDAGLILTDGDMEQKRETLETRYAEARPLVVNFPPDEYSTGGCQAAGRGFLHINADGFVEPCPFSHYAADNVRDKSLEEILTSPFFETLRGRFAEGMANPRGECLLFANDEQVRQIAAETGAFCTEHLSHALR